MFKFATNKFSSQSGGSHAASHHAEPATPQAASSFSSSSSSTATTSATESGGGGGGGSLLLSSMGLLGVGSGSGGERGQQAAASKRRQLQKDLFSFNKIADKGFPAKPSALDYDRKLKLIGMGTKNGDIRIYGAPGTPQQQLACFQDIHPFPILRLLFVQGQHQLITLTERLYRNELSNKGESQLYLVLWQIPNCAGNTAAASTSNLVEKVKEYPLDPKIVSGTRLSALTLLNDNSHLFLGFETGDIYVFNVSSFQIVPGVINKVNNG